MALRVMRRASLAALRLALRFLRFLGSESHLVDCLTGRFGILAASLVDFSLVSQSGSFISTSWSLQRFLVANHCSRMSSVCQEGKQLLFIGRLPDTEPELLPQ